MTPVVINNRNRFTTTKKLVEDLQKLGYSDIHIIDNGSTYQELLEYYTTLETCLKIHRHDNIGPRSIYDTGLISEFPSWVAYTDSDIELNPKTPDKFIEEIIYKVEKYGYQKGGLALETNDILPHQFGFAWKEWENKYWKDALEENVYKAEIDTTFCIVRKDIPFQYEALRIGGNFTCRHIPWYVPSNFKNIDAEEQYYLTHSLSDSTYKKVYSTVTQ